MNHVAMAPSAIDTFIFGDRELHFRFAMAIELLACLAATSDKPLTTGALADKVGQPTRIVRVLLANLRSAGMVHPDEHLKDAWRCAATLGSMTLADVFCSVAHADASAGGNRSKVADDLSILPERSANHGVNLLLMQATMAINQMVLQRLQLFDLGKLKAVSSSQAFHTFDARHRHFLPEPA